MVYYTILMRLFVGTVSWLEAVAEYPIKSGYGRDYNFGVYKTDNTDELSQSQNWERCSYISAMPPPPPSLTKDKHLTLTNKEKSDLLSW